MKCGLGQSGGERLNSTKERPHCKYCRFLGHTQAAVNMNGQIHRISHHLRDKMEEIGRKSLLGIDFITSPDMLVDILRIQWCFFGKGPYKRQRPQKLFAGNHDDHEPVAVPQYWFSPAKKGIPKVKLEYEGQDCRRVRIPVGHGCYSSA